MSPAQKPRQANLIYLNSDANADYIADYADAAVKELFQLNSERLKQQIIANSGGPENIFLNYCWYGHGLPFNDRHNIPFDPRLVNVIVPKNYDCILIHAERRKVALTLPPTYDGKEPQYAIVCASKNAVEGIRILPTPGAPFRGLERVFSERGFESLAKLKDCPQFGGIVIANDLVIVPESCVSVF